MQIIRPGQRPISRGQEIRELQIQQAELAQGMLDVVDQFNKVLGTLELRLLALEAKIGQGPSQVN